MDKDTVNSLISENLQEILKLESPKDIFSYMDDRKISVTNVVERIINGFTTSASSESSSFQFDINKDGLRIVTTEAITSKRNICNDYEEVCSAATGVKFSGIIILPVKIAFYLLLASCGKLDGYYFNILMKNIVIDNMFSCRLSLAKFPNRYSISHISNNCSSSIAPNEKWIICQS